MKAIQGIILIGLLTLLTPTSAIFNFFKFGLGSSNDDSSAEAASSDSASIMMPNSQSSSTPQPSPSGGYSYLFGTGVTGTQNTQASSSSSMGGGSGAGSGLLQGATNGGSIPTPSANGWSQDPLPNTSGNIHGSRTPSLSSIASINNAFSPSQAQSQNNHHPSSALPQSNPIGMSLHSTSIPSNMATNPSSMPHFNTWNPKPNLNSFQIQTPNGIRFNEATSQQQVQMQGRPNEVVPPSTSKQGSFSWTSPEGQLFEVKYVADAMGFRPTGAHIPQQQQQPIRQASNDFPYSYSQFKPMSQYP